MDLRAEGPAGGEVTGASAAPAPGAALPPPLRGVSFVATSRAAALVPQRLSGTPTPLAKIIQDSRPFRTTYFGEESGPGPRSARADGNPQGGPSPQIIQASGGKDTVAWPAAWGLVSAVVEAYNRHHELVLRPDDVWQAILTQFSFYVNAHAEELRDRFVDFQGKKTLVVTMGGTLFTADYATFARRMVDENIVTNIKDPEVVKWLLPDFSTTTAADRVAASVSVMSTLQAYFECWCCLSCGIPKVTLLGTPEDWRCLRAKIDRLLHYDLGAEKLMTRWHGLLSQVLDQFVRSAEGSPDLDFWDTVCSHHGGGSGPSYLSGWITVFAVFTSEGVWQGKLASSGRFSHWEAQELGAQGSRWPMIDFDELPVGALSVPVLVDDNGTQYDTQMFAGQFAYEQAGSDGVALQPRTDWCITYAGEAKADPRAYRHGEIR